MQLPIDIKALLDETTDIKAARETEIAVSVYIDETASPDLAAHVRNAFASTLPSVRMTLSYVPAGFIPQPTDDIAVIVAGTSPQIARYAADLRDVGVPVMVVCDDPTAVEAIAAKEGSSIPAGDLIFPDETPVSNDGEDAAASDGAKEGAVPIMSQATLPLTEARARNLDKRMGRWIVSVCREKRLAYAIAFPFVRRPLANDAVQATAVQNAAVGLVPIIPGADLPIMTLNQAKMVLQISAAYGQDMGKERIKELAAVVLGAYFSRGVARRLAAAVPVLGFLFRTGVAYGSTAAMGYAVIEYFEGGQNATGVANVLEKATAAGSKALGALRGVAQRLPLPSGSEAKR